jgi:RHS repeat-associated protein
MPEAKATEPGSAERSAFSTPTISLPKGGGAIRGIGEKFAANPVTGTGSMKVPIATSPGRSGFGPQLSLSYDSGRGNSEFGFGWSLSLPSITRKTDKGLPQYRDAEQSDVFILSGAEDLVRVLGPVQPPRTVDGVDYRIERYRPRIEGLFARIERWTNIANGEAHWRSITRDNVTTLYGKDDNSRIVGPSARVFSWLICQSYDDKGNVIAYEYAREDSEGIDPTQVHERNRTPTTRSVNRYLKRIKYGNRVSRLVEPGLADRKWMFEVVFDYGEHDAAAPTPTDPGTWPCRQDPFSAYRAGFEVRTYRLCRRVLMFHHFPGEPDVDVNCLVRSTDFTYSAEQDPSGVAGPVYTFLRAATHSGYRRADGGYLKRSLPPVEFEYTQPIVQDSVQDVDAQSLENLPIGLDGSSYQWADLHGEGIPGILTEQGGAWFYKRNVSPISDRPVEFAPVEIVATKPSLALTGGQAQFMDLAGDGQPDVVVLDGPMAGLYEHDDEEGWEPFRPFTSRLTRDTRDPNLKFVDLDGDGHSDVLISEDDAFEWHPSLAEEGFGPARRVAQGLDEEDGPRLVFADGTQSVYLADLSGDGLTDLVRIRNGEVCYWPNLGYGRFGAKVTMDNAPWFDAPDLFDQKRIRLADIDGSGTTDIIYLHRDGVRLYFNQSGNSWSLPQALRAFSRVDDVAAITPIDLLGNGTACLVWSSPLPGDARRQMRYVNLMGDAKPHLLIRTVNNLGAETTVQYAPSTRFYLQDRDEGRPWITRLPFAVHVVERVETRDTVSGNRFVSRYTYHHGYFDGEEREFRGFGMVEQQDTEEFAALTHDGTLPPATNEDPASHVPPVLTRTWFHTGAYLRNREISRHHAHEYFGAPADPVAFEAWERDELLDDTVFPDAELTSDERREAVRALKGAMLRQEVYALDNSAKAAIPYTVTEQNFTIKCLQRRDGNRHAVFFTHPLEAINYHYERDTSDPRVSHTLTLEVDAFGNVLKSATVAYGRRNADAALPQQRDRDTQAKTLCTYTENDVTNEVDEADDYRTPLPAESRTYELTGHTASGSSGRFRAADFVEPDPNDPTRLVHVFDDDIEYEAAATNGKQRRLIEQLRTLYRKNDLTGLLGPRMLHSLALPGETYKLAFTPGLVAAVFGARVTNALLSPEGGYVHSQGDSNWWIPSGRVFFSPVRADTAAQELAHARQHFFLPHRYRDPFDTNALKTETLVTYDSFDLLVMETRDALLNVVTVATEDDARVTKIRNDYRVLQPAWVTEANGNRTRLAFDALGMVVATAVMGKPAQGQGDDVEGVVADPAIGDLQAFVADPQTEAASLLVRATTRVVYDLARYQRAGQPAFAATLARETHFHDPGGDETKIQVAFSYSDGLGREIQKKIQAERGHAPQRQAPVALPTGDIRPGDLIRDQGKVVEADTALRWVGTGRTVFNNKGKPVLQYEPFFSATHLYEAERDMTDTGVSPILFYDPVERVVATLHPNHTYEKVVFDAWRQATYDVNDTVAEKLPQTGDPRTDPDISEYVRDYFKTQEGWKTWYELRIGKPEGDPERDAAEKAAAHADTPTVAHFDALGRAFVTIAQNRYKRNAAEVNEKYATRIDLDIEGNQRTVSDAKDRVVMRYDYDMLSNRIHQASMEAGERWMLNDVAGKPIRSWDSRGHAFTTEYDQLRRAGRQFVRGSDAVNSDPRSVGRDVLMEKTEYGEGQPASSNARTRVFKHFDTAGAVTSVPYDFKGNLLHSERQLVQDYTLLPDWATPPPLDAQVYAGETTYDALNRPLSVTTPDKSVVRPGYNAANLLERIDADLRGGGVTTPFITNIDYNAKGQRTLITYATTDGAGVTTTYDYDDKTFRLAKLTTKRNAAAFNGTDRPGEVQNLRYTYDPAGNITTIRDDAQPTIYFNGQVVTPQCQYTYDAMYRLVEAKGREHIGQVGPQPETTWDDRFRWRLAHPHDGQAMRTYTETYEYDPVGNIDKLIHQAVNGNWTRSFTYTEPSLLEPATTKNNRLSTSSVGHANDTDGRFVHDAHGNMARMPHLAQPADPNAPNMYWDCQDHLRRADKVGETTVFFVYDAAGQRVRKVWEKAPGQIEERLYLGGFEIFRRRDSGGTVSFARETLHVMDDTRQIALVEDGTIDTAGSDSAPAHLVRYQFANHLGSAVLELTDEAQIISYEEFYPYGTTSYQAVRNHTDTPKRYRYTGKERDEESGLYYYGVRYYAPFLARWISVDPQPVADESAYVYVRNRPVSLTDQRGAAPKTPEEPATEAVNESLSQESYTPDDFVRLYQAVWRYEDSLAEAQSRLADLEAQSRSLGEEETSLKKAITKAQSEIEEGKSDVTQGIAFLVAGVVAVILEVPLWVGVVLGVGSIATDELTGTDGADVQDYAFEGAGVAGDVVERAAGEVIENTGGTLGTHALKYAGKAAGPAADIADTSLDYMKLQESQSILSNAQNRLTEIAESKDRLARDIFWAKHDVKWQGELLEGATEDLEHAKGVAVAQWRASGGNVFKAPHYVHKNRPSSQ